MEFSFLVVFVCLWITFKYAISSPNACTAAIVIIFVLFNVIVTVTMMENLMLSALAIHRFLLYFFPNSEKFLTSSLKTLSASVKTMYIFLFVVNFIDRTIKAMMILDNLANTGEIVYVGTSRMDRFDLICMRIYFATILFLFFSASLYIPMIFSIRRLGKLQSAKKSQPEKYILYQTLYLVVLRLLYIPIVYFIFASLSEFNETMLFVGILLVDICITHFIIQASYLSCNKKHVEAIFGMCDSKKNMVVDMDIEIHSTVAHTTNSVESSL